MEEPPTRAETRHRSAAVAVETVATPAGAATAPAATPGTPTSGTAPMTTSATAIMILMCTLWGANFVAIKVGNRGFPPLLSASLRSVGAAVLVGLWLAIRGQSFRSSRRLLFHGAVTGFLFSLEFLFLYAGTSYTSASRAILLVYTSPFWVALGAHFVLRDDRLSPAKIGGLALSFVGVLAVFRAPGIGLGPDHLRGDALEVLAAIAWAATTLYVKRFIQPLGISAVQTLFYQVAFSAPVLLVAAAVAGQRAPTEWRLDSVLALLYQTVVVATISYITWFWLLQRAQASVVHSFTFFAPVFGVVFGALLLGDRLPFLLWLGLALVGSGIYLVNHPTGRA